MKKVHPLIFLAGILVLSACAPLWWYEHGEDSVEVTRHVQGPDDLGYVGHVKAQPLDFQIPASKDAEAWARAREILKKYGRNQAWCSRKVRIPTDDVLEIGASKMQAWFFKDVGFLFRIVRARRESTTDYTVSYAPLAEGSGVHLPIKAHAQVIAYYIVSGRFMDEVWSERQFDDRFR
jgi:hypothetical protein